VLTKSQRFCQRKGELIPCNPNSEKNSPTSSEHEYQSMGKKYFVKNYSIDLQIPPIGA
jgi:hypothetical protein